MIFRLQLFSALVFFVTLLVPKQLVVVDDRGHSPTPLIISAKKSMLMSGALEDALTRSFSEINRPRGTQDLRGDILLLAGDASDLGRLNGLRVSANKTSDQLSEIEPIALQSDNWIRSVKNRLNSDQRRRLDLVEKSILEDFHASSIGSIDSKVKALANEAEAEQTKRLIPTKSGSAILVAKPKTEALQGNSNRITASRVPEKSLVDQNLRPQRLELSKNRRQPFVIQGNVRVFDGLAWIPDQMKLEILRKVEGRFEEKAYLWEYPGAFQIQIKELVGQLVAQLRDSDNNLIGEGEIDLEDLPVPANYEARVKDVFIDIKSVEQIQKVRTLSIHSLGGKEFLEKEVAATHASSLVEISNNSAELIAADLVDRSISELILEKEGFIATRVKADFSEKQDVYVFPDKFIKALVSLVLDPHKAAIKGSDGIINGIIMGQVLDADKRPISGASIELAEHDHLQPIFFNELFLPDPSLTATSQNGLYAFVDLKQGHYAIRAVQKSERFPAQVISVTQGVVTQVLFEEAPKKRVTLNLASLLSKNSKIGGEASIFGADQNYVIEDSKSAVLTTLTSQHQILEIQPQESFVPARVNFYPSKRHLNVFLMESSEVSKKILEVGLGTFEDGIIYGPGLSQNYEVIVESMSSSEKVGNILFGNNWKSLIQKPYGSPGDSFVVLGLQPGFYSVAILPRDGEQVYSDLIFSEPGVANFVSDPRSAAL